MEVPVVIKGDGQTPSILTRPLMAMDGNLLSAFWKSGSCIPDKLIDKEDILNELIDEVLLAMKLKTQIEDPGDLLDLIRNHRRGSTASSKLYNVKTKEKQRRSWGPDDTWSSRFVSKQSLKKDDKQIKKEKEEKEKEKKSKRSSSMKTPKKTYKHSHTESVLSLRNCQPLNSYQNRGNNNKRDDDDSDDEDLQQKVILQNNAKKLNTKRRELMKMMSWISDEGYDYIHSEKVKNISEVEVFIDVMLSASVPVQMTFKVNSPTDINITYQFLNTFKDDFMVLTISKTHCMVMRAF